MPVLQFIETENFKSYGGKVKIGPLEAFNAVIGPNGSGKSNFMDAVSFVMGVKTRPLRVEKLGELIHGASVSQPKARTASVSATFRFDDGTLKKYTRIAKENGQTVEYQIDGHTVDDVQQYFASLKELSINVKANNFLIFQGEIESIAMMKPKERTELFEEISESGALKNEYERLRSQLLKAESETNDAYLRKRNFASEKKEAEATIQGAETYRQLRKDLSVKIIEHQLFRLSHIENEITTSKNEIANKKKKVEEIEKRKKEAEKTSKELEKKQKQAEEELIQIEEEIRKLEMEKDEKRPLSIKSKERVCFLKNKLNSATKALERAHRADHVYSKEIEDLERELAEIEAQIEGHEHLVRSQKPGKNVQLSDTQREEYNILKGQARKRLISDLREFNSINREQEADQDRLVDDSLALKELELRIERKEREKAESHERVNQLAEYIEATKSALRALDGCVETMKADFDVSKKKAVDIQSDLEKIIEELDSVKLDKHVDYQKEEKQNVIGSLKKTFPGAVHGRLIDLCQPISRRYDVAITKAFGKYLNAIVVDTEATAKLCIQHLKRNLSHPETFLPLDFVKAEPLREHLRNIQTREGVKLLYDVLQFDSSIDRVIQFVTNNTLVCETAEDAMYVAFEMEQRRKYDAVSIDGTFYKKSGIISGGRLDLERKAKRWDEKRVSELKANREKLTNMLRETLKQCRKEFDLNVMNLQQEGLNTRLKGVESDRERILRQISDVDAELETLKRELTEYVGPRVKEVEKRMRLREEKIRETKERMNRVEDEVFADFCRRVGLDNVREYEELDEFRFEEERVRERQEFEDEKNRIINRLECVRIARQEASMQNGLQRWQKTVSETEEELESASELVESERIEEVEGEAKAHKFTEIRAKKKSEVNSIEEAVKKARKNISQLTREWRKAQKELLTATGDLEARLLERHGVLKWCQMENIAIPLLQGDLLEEALARGLDHHESVARIVVDYSSLPSHLRAVDDKNATEAQLVKTMNDLSATLEKMEISCINVSRRLELAQEGLKRAVRELNSAQTRAKKAKRAFENIKRERYNKFMSCFEFIAGEIDDVYKALVQNQSAQAALTCENPEEPYLGGTYYNCVAPGKRFQPMFNLSGGERTVAALALLFAVHSYQPTPFFVLDEIDAALDNTNINKIAEYIRQKKDLMQMIIISLKEEFFVHADALIGICPDGDEECLKSKVITLNLAQYSE